MPTPVTHAAVGFALGAWTQRGAPTRRVCVAAATCAALPDIDAIGWSLPVSDASLFSHRAITHSLAFALAAALVTTMLFFKGPEWATKRVEIGAILSLALISHICLDALSTYSVGVEFFAPFSQQRYRFRWTPLGDPARGVTGQLIQEAIFVFVPAVFLGWLGARRRQRSPKYDQ